MSQFDELAKDRVYSFLKETSEPFYYVRNYLMLIEEIIPDYRLPHKTSIEVKNLLFNLYDIIAYPEQAAINIQKAKELLIKTFYELHNTIVTASCDRIRSKVKQFKSSTIANAFSEYGSIIRPTIRDAQMQIIELESNQNSDITILQEDLYSYFNQVKLLNKFDSVVEDMIPELHRYEAEKRNQHFREKTWDLCKIILAALIGGTVTWLITKK